MCVLYSSGTNWVLTAAHCLHHSLDPEDPTLHSSDLLSPSDFKIVMGEWEGQGFQSQLWFVEQSFPATIFKALPYEIKTTRWLSSVQH